MLCVVHRQFTRALLTLTEKAHLDHDPMFVDSLKGQCKTQESQNLKYHIYIGTRSGKLVSARQTAAPRGKTQTPAVTLPRLSVASAPDDRHPSGSSPQRSAHAILHSHLAPRIIMEIHATLSNRRGRSCWLSESLMYGVVTAADTGCALYLK